jgi:hypothetical protein
MAKFIPNPVVTIDGDDFSDHFRSCNIEGSFEEVDVTAFGATYREILSGLGDVTMTFEAFQDFATNEIDQNLWPIFDNQTPVEVTVKPFNAAISATNPEYSMTAVLTTYNPINAAVGEASTMTLTFRNQSQTGLVRAFT